MSWWAIDVKTAAERKDPPPVSDLERTQNQELHEPPKCRSTLPPTCFRRRSLPDARVLQGFLQPVWSRLGHRYSICFQQEGVFQ